MELSVVNCGLQVSVLCFNRILNKTKFPNLLFLFFARNERLKNSSMHFTHVACLCLVI